MATAAKVPKILTSPWGWVRCLSVWGTKLIRGRSIYRCRERGIEREREKERESK